MEIRRPNRVLRWDRPLVARPPRQAVLDTVQLNGGADSSPLMPRQFVPLRLPSPVESATEIQPADDAGTQQVKREYRQAWNEAQRELEEARRAGVPARDGVTEVVTRYPDGRSRMTRYDDQGRLYVQYRNADGTVDSSLYRDGDRVLRNMLPDAPHRPSADYRLDADGRPQRVTFGGGQPGSRLTTVDSAGRSTTREMNALDGDPSRAEGSDPVPGLRRVLDPLGLDGRGQTIAVIDDLDPFTGSGGHSNSVSSVSRRVAPGARVEEHTGISGMEKVTPPGLPPNMPDSEDALKQALASWSPLVMDRVTGALEKLGPHVRAANVSMAGTRVSYYEAVLQALESRPQLRQAVVGGATGDEAMKKVAEYVDRQLEQPESAYSRSLARYQGVVESLAKRKPPTMVVVAAGNNGPGGFERDARWQRVRPGALGNDLARSPYVINVAASDRGRIWDRSTHGEGEGGEMNPTIAAQGVDVKTPYGVSSGTSLAAPFVAGVVALMFQASPHLTAEQVIQILRDSATPTAGGVATGGSGVLRPDEAVLRARGSPPANP